MTTRTFKQLGIAFGNATATITAKVDNVVVYQGPVTTLNEPFPDLPNVAYVINDSLFSWTTDVTYSGPASVEVEVDENSDLIVADIAANYSIIPNPAYIDANTTPTVPQYISSGPDGFETINPNLIGNVYIDGVLQTVDHTQLPGQWWWELTVPDTILKEITITPGKV